MLGFHQDKMRELQARIETKGKEAQIGRAVANNLFEGYRSGFVITNLDSLHLKAQWPESAVLF
jgi:hypothetical protein